jgi:hypothetical protein
MSGMKASEVDSGAEFGGLGLWFEARERKGRGKRDLCWWKGWEGRLRVSVEAKVRVNCCVGRERR